MSKLFFYDDNPSYIVPTYRKPRKRYGFWKFVFDCFMVIITSGFWLIWIFIREMRKR